MANSDHEQTHGPSPKIGILVEQHSQQLLNKWQELAEERLPSGERTIHRVALRDHLPKYLLVLAQDLQSGWHGDARASRLSAEDHGVQRWEIGWNLESVIRDYQIMRHVLVTELEALLDRRLQEQESASLNDLLDEGIADAVRSFLNFEEASGVAGPDQLENQQLAAIVRSSNLAIIGLTHEGVIKTWNQGATELYGYAPADVEGKHAAMLFPLQRRIELDRFLQLARRGQHGRSIDSVHVHQTGKNVSVAISASPIKDADDKIVGCALFANDVIDRVRVADAMRDALEEAERANRIKSEFLANVSHELRTPMNAIVGMTELAIEENTTPELKDYLETTRSAAESLLSLVNDILDISKLESGRFELDETEFEIRELLDNTLKVLGSRAYQKGLELACHVAPEVPQVVYGDPVRLRQVLTNLIGNAIKFTDQGEVVIDVSLDVMRGKTCILRFSVSDTGIGISDSDQKEIFQPFTQVDSSSTRSVAGTGLGLAIASHLINCLHGHLWVQSEIGVGSIFYFTAQLSVGDDSKTVPSEKETRDASLVGMRVLIADDNQTSREILSESLGTWQMEPSLAEGGEIALRMLRAASNEGEPYKLAIIDALMPDMDGFKLIKEIDADPALNTEVILMITPTDRLTFAERCENAKPAAFLDKPFSQSGTYNAIAKALKLMPLVKTGADALSQSDPNYTLRILLAEDTSANRKVVLRVLSKRGHEIKVAHNGREAVEMFRHEEFDVVLMDVQMPSMDGLQATEAIREHENFSGRRSRIPIIAMTAHAMRGDREKCIAAGMDDYLSKPIDIRELVRVVERHGGAAASEEWEPMSDEGQSNGSISVEQNKAPAIDLSEALQRLRGDKQLLAELIEFFLEDYSGLLQDIDGALATRAWPELVRQAHSLKGLIANFESGTAWQTAAAMEQAAKNEDLETALSLQGKLRSTTECLAKSLQGFKLA